MVSAFHFRLMTTIESATTGISHQFPDCFFKKKLRKEFQAVLKAGSGYLPWREFMIFFREASRSSNVDFERK